MTMSKWRIQSSPNTSLMCAGPTGVGSGLIWPDACSVSNTIPASSTEFLPEERNSQPPLMPVLRNAAYLGAPSSFTTNARWMAMLVMVRAPASSAASA